ncbi:HIT domain-containing protein [Legionella waltersii]|uniref:Diadenosine tetraphosphate (Ap4A) hydrolase-like HIT family hydrolase n=1 Tax=Legionella waltersii TaxID=66969 RepID=A0A0W1A2G6_9GAMM|nr:HIT domain-containing protein [Legionella waltersii]KTD75535.1 diadenosine tetraphosphate (Ap4A) hydrolase-like HIT family hydrolase [Legionella waltersii]SNU98545.1 diadenosine tetraphosphate (Ap4A) hydrolase-like HIT family hydrolase [Legionella waltersii]
MTIVIRLFYNRLIQHISKQECDSIGLEKFIYKKRSFWGTDSTAVRPLSNDTLVYWSSKSVEEKELFTIDDRILATSVVLGEWQLSTVLLKNDASYPWLILLPKRKSIKELYQLDQGDRVLLTEEIYRASMIMKDFFNPYKLNVGSLGNVVEQLHIHIVGRNQTDPLWPQGIWQASSVSVPYQENELFDLTNALRKLVCR